MKYVIAHRGNIDGPNLEKENTLEYINEAIYKGYNCEIDLWEIDSLFYLGHDKPEHLVSLIDLISLQNYLWIHCKNYKALELMMSDKINGGNFNFFWHNNDLFTITSKGFLWCYPSTIIYKHGINLMPEINEINISKFKDCLGVCSDYVNKLK